MLSVLSSIFWGLMTLSVLVFVHEGGHFLAARACGVRVTEFFLGLPCRFRLERRSRACGTVFGVTPLLLGGYAAIAGMDPETSPHAASVLGHIHRRGTADVDEIADELGLDPADVIDACGELLAMGSIVGAGSDQVPLDSAYMPMRYAAAPRDRSGNTVLDGRAFAREEATAEGEPWDSALTDEQFLALERSRTYQGVGFTKRALMLLAGIAVNVFCGMLLLMSVYSVVGVHRFDYIGGFFRRQLFDIFYNIFFQIRKYLGNLFDAQYFVKSQSFRLSKPIKDSGYIVFMVTFQSVSDFFIG